MRSRKAILSLFSLLLSASIAAADTKTFTARELAARPDLLPAKITLNQTFNFADGVSATAGQAVTPLRVESNEVLVDAGNELVFSIPIASSDLLKAAADSWAALTPEQQAIAPDTLPGDPSLWPATIVTKGEFSFGNGVTIPSGAELPVVQLDAKNVHLVEPTSKMAFTASFSDTDVFTRARELALTPRADRPARLPALLSKELVDSDGNAVALPEIDDSTVFVFYAGASWCGPCRVFAPKLVEFLEQVGPQNPKLVVLHFNADRERPAMLQYMKDEKMPWPGVPFNRVQEEPLLIGYATPFIPRLTAVDRFGKVLYDGTVNGRPAAPTIEGFKAFLDTGIAK